MRVTIVGGGEIGFALAQALSEHHEVFVVDHAPHVADRFEPLDVQFVLPGDRLIVFTTYAAADRVRDYFTTVNV